MPLRIGVVGCGTIARIHMKNLSEMEEVEIVSIWGDGILAMDSPDIIVEESKIEDLNWLSGSTTSGIRILYSDGIILHDNNITNSGNGIFLENCTAIVANNSILAGNYSDIALHASTPCIIKNNTRYV